MNAETLPAILAAAGGLLATIGLGVKWLITKVEIQVKAAADKEAEARGQLSTRLNREIDDLRDTVKELRTMLKDAAQRETVYMRRILILENHINQQPGLRIPDSPGWPPA